MATPPEMLHSGINYPLFWTIALGTLAGFIIVPLLTFSERITEQESAGLSGSLLHFPVQLVGAKLGINSVQQQV